MLQPIGIVFFNRVSQSIAEGADHVRELSRHALALSVAAATLCVVPVICGGDFLLQGLWGSEKFSLSQIHDTHLALVILVALLVGNAQYLITRRTNLALKVVARQYIASGLVQIAAGLLCRWLTPSFGLWGAVGLQVFAVVLMAFASLLVLQSENKSLVSVMPIRKSFLWLIAGSASVLATMLIRSCCAFGFTENRFEMVLVATGFAVVSLMCCLTFSWLMGIPESREIASKVRGRLLRKFA